MVIEAAETLHSSELSLWTILRRFEELALKQYQTYLPTLATTDKQQLVSLLSSQVPSNSALNDTNLAAPLDELTKAATANDAVQTLVIQGLLLETLGKTIYQMFAKEEVFSANTRALCTAGLKLSEITKKETQKLIKEKIGDGEELFQKFITVSKPVIMQLDALGEHLDQHFSERFGISFSDLLGEFVAELLSFCVELGMERRKVVGYLTGVLMGI